MDPVTYLTTFTTDFGALEWVFFIAQIALVVAGVYLTFLRVEPHAIRRASSHNLGYALLGLGGLGIVLGALRLAPVGLFTMPLWFAITTALEAILAIYAAYYILAILPARVAAYNEANRSRGARRSAGRAQPVGTLREPPLQANGTHGTGSFSEPRPVATTSRRDARRDRKRKTR
jgi:hypothetical protein